MRTGCKLICLGRWRVELHWPEIVIERKPKLELMLGFDSVASFRVDRRHGLYVAFGFMVLGIGFGIDYFKERK